jgi:NAD(P)H-dependent FMN reductase
LSATTTLRLQIIIGSTREGRAADRFLPWLTARAEAHPRFEVEVLDLRDWDLPMFAETRETVAAGYSSPTVRRWNETIARGDAYLFVTPEYNHSTTAVLKNAMDSVFASNAFRNKAAGFVGYSAGRIGGARAVEHLASIAIEAELAPLRNSVLIGGVHDAFTVDGTPTGSGPDHALEVLLDDLAWWAGALRTARDAGELPLPHQRRRPTAA